MSHRKLLRHPVVRILGSLLILGLLFFFVPLHKLTFALRHISPLLWVKVLLAFLLVHFLGTLKWRLTLRLSDARLTLPQAICCYYAGLFGTLFLPSVVGGDVVRLGLALRTERHKAGIVLGSLVDRLLDIVALGVVAAIGAALIPGALDPRSRKAFRAIAIAAAIGVAALIAVLVLIPWRQLPYKLQRKVVELRRAARTMSARRGYVLISLLLGVIVQALLVALAAVIAASCGLHLPFRSWMLVWPMAKLLALVPVTLGGLGIREAGLSALLAPFGVPMAMAVAAGLAWESIILAGGLGAGVISALMRMASGRQPSSSTEESDSAAAPTRASNVAGSTQASTSTAVGP
jgi:glycosyltransferase 2 family protein